MRTLVLTVVLAALAPSARAATALPFTADDVVGARAQAMARKLPLFVEVWAPW